MFTAILAIAGVLALVAVAAWFFVEYGAVIADMWSWALGTMRSVTAIFPDWLLPFVLIALALAVILPSILTPNDIRRTEYFKTKSQKRGKLGGKASG